MEVVVVVVVGIVTSEALSVEAAAWNGLEESCSEKYCSHKSGGKLSRRVSSESSNSPRR